MANWGLMHVQLDRIVTDAEVLEAAQALWDSYDGGRSRPLIEEWTDSSGQVCGGRDHCLRPGRRITGTAGAVRFSVDARLYELWMYDGGRAVYTYSAVIGLVERLSIMFSGCRVFMSGDGTLHTELIEVSREEVLDELRHARDAEEQLPDQLEHEVEAAELLEHELSEPPLP